MPDPIDPNEIVQAGFDLADYGLADDLDFGREGEDATARDENDILIRRQKATLARFQETVKILIDGYPVEIQKSIPRTDAQGNPLHDENGNLIPRNTTIYDAARQLVADGKWTDADLKERIPVLCHMPHLHPIGVCRMCSVAVAKRSERGGKVELKGNRKLAPACWHEVQESMVVNTRVGKIAGEGDRGPMSADEVAAHESAAKKAADTISKSVGVLAELLLADHTPERITWQASDGETYVEGERYENELEAVGRMVAAKGPRERLRKPAGAFSRNRMAAEEPSETDPLRPFTKPLRRIALDTLDATPVKPEDRRLGGNAVAAWEAWNELVDGRFPYSARTVVVDHDKCIVCDRCVRSCSEVKPFKVIGHTGKGYTTRISFDLDYLMRESSCVQCGECMTACPTGALSLRRRVQPRAWKDDDGNDISPELIPQNPNTPFKEGSDFLTADQIRKIWVYYVPPGAAATDGRVVFPFASVPFAYLKWNEGAVRRRVVKSGSSEVLGWGGEYGTTAFLMSGTGKFRIYPAETRKSTPGWIGRLLGRRDETTVLHEYDEKKRIAEVPGNQLLIGEMAPLTQKPRGATIEVLADPDEPPLRLLEPETGRFMTAQATDIPKHARDVVVYEVTRNLLDMMLRAESAREAIREVYEYRAIERGVNDCKMFEGLPEARKQEVKAFLLGTKELEFRRVEPGEAIVAQGDRADDFYILRLGNAEVFTTVSDRKQKLALLSDRDYIGEVALLADEMRAEGVIPAGSDQSRRTATVAALDLTEVVRIPGEVFGQMCFMYPEVQENLIKRAVARVKGTGGPPVPQGLMADFITQGLYQGQRMLVLDLTKCTRCDECTRACADSHPEGRKSGHARLLREGLRFGDYLVATSCRSCHTPYCMNGCPVDAIHRQGNHLEVIIEDHCIGCGLCERNCPYGSIQMVHRDKPNPAAAGFKEGNPLMTAAPRRAVNCDLCGGDEPFCVQACPHEAAHRVTGDFLFKDVVARANRR